MTGLSKKYVWIVALLLMSSGLLAQTPVANRVAAAVASLPQGARDVARYTDNRRHCLYYTFQERLYKIDVFSNTNLQVRLAPEGYERIIASFTSPRAQNLFIVVDKGDLAGEYMTDGQELWKIDTLHGTVALLGSGFHIEKRKGSIVIRKGIKCLNPSAPLNRQQWMATDHFLDFEGKIIYAKGEYKMKRKG